LIRRDMASCRRGLFARPRGSLTGHRVAAEEDGEHDADRPRHVFLPTRPVVAPRTSVTDHGVLAADNDEHDVDRAAMFVFLRGRSSRPREPFSPWCSARLSQILRNASQTQHLAATPQ
jgi:hypothetical protein